ncbi:MAG TPA: NRDE family protein [Woeseiaceae bacterium]|nr:NRDE family protein [Woeseiaceae bacterium]
MCLVAFAFRAHPDYRLVLAANRDEFHGRPAAAMHWWADYPSLLGGRDLKAGGTWLAISESGRFGAVTNYREDLETQAGPRSRGELVPGFVAGADSPLAYCRAVDPAGFAGFSLLAAAGDAMAYVSNRGDAARSLVPGVYALSNASLDTPWTKVVRSKRAIESMLSQKTIDVEALFRLLADREPAKTDDVGTGLAPELARAVSAPFIVTPDYGTRCSTVLLIGASGAAEIHERRFDSAGDLAGETRFEFST